MAPRTRGRPRKKGLTRMDAALDAMKIFGFSEGLTVKTIKDLLKVYGEDGWPFIEESAYKVLLETILEKGEKEEQQKDKEIGGNDTERSAAGPSTRTLVPTFSPVEEMDIESPTNEVLDSASQTNGALGTALPLPTNECDAKNHLPPANGEGSSGVAHVEKNSCSPPHVFHSPQPVDSRRPRTRRPCYGWLCSDDEEDLVELPPAPLSGELVKFLFGTDLRRKRRSRWDVRPEDM